MSEKLERPEPPYLQIARAIRRDIQEARLRPGDRVMSVRDLMQEYGVALATAQRAMKALQAEGFVRSEPGVGNVVTTEAERGWGAGGWVERARRTGKVYPEGQFARVRAAEIVPAPEAVAAVFGLSPGEPAIRRERVTHGRDETPLSWSVSWFLAEHAEVAPLLLEVERIKQGTFTYLAMALGREAVRWRDQVCPAGATPDDVARLDIGEGAPVLHSRNWIYDDLGEVLEYGESASTGRLTYEGDVGS